MQIRLSVDRRSLQYVHPSGTRMKEFDMKVSQYYSSNPSDPDVHHDHNDCPSGQQIPPQNKRLGTNRYPRCGHCVKKG